MRVCVVSAYDCSTESLARCPPCDLAQTLAPGLYRLLVCHTITDANGDALDGDGGGVPGGDFVFSVFRADPSNLFENGHFDVFFDGLFFGIEPAVPVELRQFVID